MRAHSARRASSAARAGDRTQLMDRRHPNSFGARDTLDVAGRALEIFRLDALQDRFDIARLPFSLKILLENLLRTEDGQAVTREDIEALAGWEPAGTSPIEIA